MRSLDEPVSVSIWGMSHDAEITYNLGLFLFTLIVVVFIEEFFFRAFLIPRAGMIPATLIFTFFHYGYGSIAEIIG